MATLAFSNAYAAELWKNFPEAMCSSDNGTNKYIETLVAKMGTAMFDARVFSIPKDEVCNCLIWRQQDATRNSIESVGHANFSQKELHGKSCNSIQDMLWKERGINWNDFPVDCKRGSACYSESDLLGLTSFEQVVNTQTDTTIYAFNKLVSLLLNCNPNTIEMLGCKPEHYFYISDIGREMIANRKMFLSKRAVHSFGGYANQQLRRLENALARDRLSQARREEHILNSISSHQGLTPKTVSVSLTQDSGTAMRRL